MFDRSCPASDGLRRGILGLCLGCVVGLFAVVGPAIAEDVVVTGDVGQAGAEGEAGGNGFDGSNGGEAIASSDSAEVRNTATATGGLGGAGGAGGLPNGNGGDGGAGGHASAEALADIDVGTVSAIAGATGGRGGAGGEVDEAGAGVGGSAGRGGDAGAIASASTQSGYSGFAEATASGGIGGHATGMGARAGDGGDAAAMASAEGDSYVTVRAEANGGQGGGGAAGADAGDGGNALLTHDSTVGATTAPLASLILEQTARGGDGGHSTGGVAGGGGDASTSISSLAGAGGLLRLELMSIAGDAGTGSGMGTAGRAGDANSIGEAAFEGDIRIEATSRGGDGAIRGLPGSGQVGGSATARAVGVSAAADSTVTSIVSASGGHGGAGRGAGARGGDGGVATASGSAAAPVEGLGEAAVHVTLGGGIGGDAFDGADTGNGGDVFGENLAAGTGASVTLGQVIFGGASGRNFNPDLTETTSRGGNATSILESVNPDGHLSLSSHGTGGTSDWGAVQAGTAHASAVGTAAGDVSIHVESRAGANRSVIGTEQAGADGSAATLGPVRGESTNGGDVYVEADVYGGSGGRSSIMSGDGLDVLLVDAVEGETTGALSLYQRAFAGHGGELTSSASTTSSAGRGGHAVSDLTQGSDSESLLVRVESVGGNSGGLTPAGALAGGDALSRGAARNESGEAVVDYAATGGTGGDSSRFGLNAGAGGSATAIAHATTAGNGQAVRIGLGFGTAVEGGRGGDSDGSNFFTPNGGRGGDAQTEVLGIAEGDSEVDVRAVAAGGQGGHLSSSAVAPTRAGAGGDATADAVGMNAGASDVNVLASAEGGWGGSHIPETLGGHGGLATATAHGASTGGGDVTVTARVVGGLGQGGGVSTDGILVDAVSGETTGSLRLVQEATGGPGASFRFAGGDASSDLTWVDDDGGTLEIESVATGGDGAGPGAAQASASGTGLDDVYVTARATGGRAFGLEADGGQASLGVVEGISLSGGQVVVEGEAFGGSGTEGGADIVVENAVSGQTSGTLQLIQRATGGVAGHADPTQIAEAAGTATSRLVRSGSSAQFDVVVEALGGIGSSQSTSHPNPAAGPGAGAGGGAVSEADVTNDQGAVGALAWARGGRGGTGYMGGQGGDGGNALVRVVARSEGTGHDVAIGGEGEFGAIGGLADRRADFNHPGESGVGGDADSRSEGIALGDSRVSVHDRAVGGEGLDGGDAMSHALARNAGSESVSAFAEAIGGLASRPGGQGGSAQATARGESTTGDVSVETLTMAGENGIGLEGGGPAHASGISVTDSASGATAGTLTLIQRVIGTAAGALDLGSGIAGMAESLLEGTNEGGGNLVLVSEATGGRGFEGDTEGGSAIASARGIGADDSTVDVLAIARGGEGSPRGTRPATEGLGAGGAATAGFVSGESALGGAVAVRAEAYGGIGGRIGFGGGSGGAASLIDAVSGSTSGVLSLEQLAVGGTGATGGRATSQLDRSVSASEVHVLSESRAGWARDPADGGDSGHGGVSEATLRIVNDSGTIDAQAGARGGNGFDVPSGRSQMNGNGGDAHVHAYAQTTGDGQTLILGDASGVNQFAAIGGSAGFNFSTTDLGGGVGGNATSRSEGIADGNSVVEVYDRASGGRGGNSTVLAGRGGTAHSLAIGRNVGVENVVVRATAFGGRGGQNASNAAENANDGIAIAHATGSSTAGAVDVTATSFGRIYGTGSDPIRPGGAIAHSMAVAEGVAGRVGALSQGKTGELGVPGFLSSATTEGSVVSSARVEARSGGPARDALSSELDAAAFVDGAHARSGEWSRIGLNLHSSQNGPDIMLTAQAGLSNHLMAPETLDGIFVSFLELNLDESTFEDVFFRIENGEDVLFEETFDQIADVTAFFGSVLDLGDLDAELVIESIDLRFTLGMESAAFGEELGTLFAVGVVPVPEPGTGLLIAMGLGVMALRRPRRDD